MRTLALFAALGLAGACERSPSTGPEGARPVLFGAVGPIPGQTQIAPSPNPLGMDRQTLTLGRRLFHQYNCDGCHGGHGGGGMGPSLRDPVWLFGSSPRQVFNSIAQGRGHGMPSWGTRLPDEQIWQLAAYIASLETPEEPEPPK